MLQTTSHSLGQSLGTQSTADTQVGSQISESEIGIDRQMCDSSTQLTVISNELCPATNASTQTPVYWHFKGTQTNTRSWSRGKT